MQREQKLKFIFRLSLWSIKRNSSLASPCRFAPSLWCSEKGGHCLITSLFHLLLQLSLSCTKSFPIKHTRWQQRVAMYLVFLLVGLKSFMSYGNLRSRFGQWWSRVNGYINHSLVPKHPPKFISYDRRTSFGKHLPSGTASARIA